jgi:hypothetical protein
VLEAWLRRERNEHGGLSASVEAATQSNPVF